MIVPTMPHAEAEHLRNAYSEARVILEFGSGNSTQLACQMRGKLILSVESDLNWARNLRREISETQPASPAIIYHVDIGPTGAWGRPIDDSGWKNYHLYPNAIWDEPFFRHPDVVLIDGRFRPACLIATMMHITRPVTVLFDDYTERPRYKLIEEIISPARIVGRMAEFQVRPNSLLPEDITFAIGTFFDVSVHGQGKSAYRVADSSRKSPSTSQ